MKDTLKFAGATFLMLATLVVIKKMHGGEKHN